MSNRVVPLTVRLDHKTFTEAKVALVKEDKTWQAFFEQCVKTYLRRKKSK